MSEQDEKKPVSDIEVLHPDRTLLIGNPRREITVREFRFLEGMTAHILAKPIIADMLILFGTTDVEAIGLDELSEVFEKHKDALVSMMAIVTDTDAEFIESLGDTDGQTLFLTFWQVNMLFFVRRLLVKRKEQQRAGERNQMEKAAASGGEKSIPA